jgi:hypothetical protein
MDSYYYTMDGACKTGKNDRSPGPGSSEKKKSFKFYGSMALAFPLTVFSLK